MKTKTVMVWQQIKIWSWVPNGTRSLDGLSVVKWLGPKPFTSPWTWRQHGPLKRW